MELFDTKNILGDVARKNRKGLLLISSISIAYKILEMEITGWSAQGSAWTIGRSDLIPWILAAITLYFLAMFIYHVRIDKAKFEKSNVMMAMQSIYQIIVDGRARGKVKIETLYAELKQGLFDRDEYVKADKELDNIKIRLYIVEYIFPLIYTAISIGFLIWWN